MVTENASLSVQACHFVDCSAVASTFACKIRHLETRTRTSIKKCLREPLAHFKTRLHDHFFGSMLIAGCCETQLKHLPGSTRNQRSKFIWAIAPVIDRLRFLQLIPQFGGAVSVDMASTAFCVDCIFIRCTSTATSSDSFGVAHVALLPACNMCLSNTQRFELFAPAIDVVLAFLLICQPYCDALAFAQTRSPPHFCVNLYFGSPRLQSLRLCCAASSSKHAFLPSGNVALFLALRHSHVADLCRCRAAALST
eukprot:194499-Pleurochrysis_carterae.AAC.1